MFITKKKSKCLTFQGYFYKKYQSHLFRLKNHNTIPENKNINPREKI